MPGPLHFVSGKARTLQKNAMVESYQEFGGWATDNGVVVDHIVVLT